jgi:hypothetical protein
MNHVAERDEVARSEVEGLGRMNVALLEAFATAFSVKM